MIRERMILMASLACLYSAPAFGEDVPVKNLEDNGIAEHLDNIIESAIDGGLLVSNVDREASSDTHSEPSASLANPDEHGCKGTDIDFTKYQSLIQYSDLSAFVRNSNGSDAEQAYQQSAAYIEALLSLGLFDEAQGLLSEFGLQRSAFYNAIIQLLHSDNINNSALIAGFNLCYNSDLWRSIALLANNEPEGITLISQNLRLLRMLPMHMRVEVSLIVIPTLIKMGGETTANNIIASFTVEEIAASGELRFLQVLSQIEQGGSTSALLDYLHHNQFRKQALSILSQRDKAGDALIDSLPSQDLIAFLNTAPDEHDRLILLDAILRKLAADRDYSDIVRLAARGDLKSPAAQTKIIEYFGETLRDDLAGIDTHRALQAIGVMLDETELLKPYSGRAELYDIAIQLADGLGYSALVAELGAQAPVDHPAALAKLAFHTADGATLYAIANTYPADKDINLLAAHFALKTSEIQQLASFETRSATDAEAAIELLEADVAADTWVISDKTWQVAASAKEARLIKRFNQLNRMRDKRHDMINLRAPNRVADAKSILTDASDWFKRLREEES